jgi:hypothetical protein
MSTDFIGLLSLPLSLKYYLHILKMFPETVIIYIFQIITYFKEPKRGKLNFYIFIYLAFLLFLLFSIILFVYLGVFKVDIYLSVAV